MQRKHFVSSKHENVFLLLNSMWFFMQQLACICFYSERSWKFFHAEKDIFQQQACIYNHLKQDFKFFTWKYNIIILCFSVNTSFGVFLREVVVPKKSDFGARLRISLYKILLNSSTLQKFFSMRERTILTSLFMSISWLVWRLQQRFLKNWSLFPILGLLVHSPQKKKNTKMIYFLDSCRGLNDAPMFPRFNWCFQGVSVSSFLIQRSVSFYKKVQIGMDFSQA